MKIARVAKKIWRMIKTIASIFGENMLGYLSLDIICSLLGTDNVRGQISEHIFAPNVDYCLCNSWVSNHLRAFWFPLLCLCRPWYPNQQEGIFKRIRVAALKVLVFKQIALVLLSLSLSYTFLSIMCVFFFLLKNRECTTHLEGKRKGWFIEVRALAAYLCYNQVWVSPCKCGER